MRRLFLAAAAAQLLATAAMAQQPEPQKSKDDGDKIVCKSESYVGSHIRSRVCKKKSEWEKARNDARDALDSQSIRVPGQPLPTGG